MVDNLRYFNNPPKEFRGLPFWAWNTYVTEEKITKEVKAFKDMGLGGFVIHVRHGLRDKYMGEKFLKMVNFAVEEAKKNDLIVWLYDEDRWPSGCTGGIVTKEKRYRQKTLLFTNNKIKCVSSDEGIKNGLTWLLAAYKITFDIESCIKSCELTDTDNANYFAYVVTAPDNPRYNGQAYVDVLDKEAIQKFIETTYDKYYENNGDDFNGQIEAIFTDEPQTSVIQLPKFSAESKFEDFKIAWSNDFCKTYFEAYNDDITSRLPELIWEYKDNRHYTTRYRYNEHIAERFRRAYTQPIGKWCREHNIAFTGHFMLEGSLLEQVRCTKDVMRCYPDLCIPGIDNLCGRYEFTTAKQCQSVARQCDLTRVMSELYGVTNWTSDFRDYIHQGNWQAAMGITARVPHLTWMTMKGVGKRDYPANFGYQSPWYKEFGRVEDHFARVNAVITSGKPVVNVAVVHPVESYWFYFGANDKNAKYAAAKDEEFDNLCKWLAFDGIDFDYINEALIPEQYDYESKIPSIGTMTYNAVIIPNCITLRSTTLKALEDMKKKGIKIIFAGEIPSYVDALESKSVDNFVKQYDCDHVAFTKHDVLKALYEYRSFELFDGNGIRSAIYIHQERKIEDKRYFFISRASKVNDKDGTAEASLYFKIKGHYTPEQLDTFSGKSYTPEYTYEGEYTVITLKKYSYSSFLIALEEGKKTYTSATNNENKKAKIITPRQFNYIREEDNVCLLDLAEYSYDGVNYFEKDEILHIDTVTRKKNGLPLIIGSGGAQPWSVNDNTEYPVFLRYTFEADGEFECKLAYEEIRSLYFNGTQIEIKPNGSYVDDDILTVPLSKTQRGKNELIVCMTLGRKDSLEPVYLLGDFNVNLSGTECALTSPSSILSFGDITSQGLPFYGGNITYTAEIETPEGELEISVPSYRAELLTVFVDGEEQGAIILPPYRAKTKKLSAGKHTLSIKCFGNRNNTFGSLHCRVQNMYVGPNHWYQNDENRQLEYKLCENGILCLPQIHALEITNDQNA